MTAGVRSGIGLKIALCSYCHTRKIEQILARLLAEMNVTQERMDANLREMKAEIRANNEKFEVLQVIIISQMNIHQARMEFIQNMKAKMDAW
jgi:hypothetical protein